MNVDNHLRSVGIHRGGLEMRQQGDLARGPIGRLRLWAGSHQLRLALSALRFEAQAEAQLVEQWLRFLLEVPPERAEQGVQRGRQGFRAMQML